MTKQIVHCEINRKIVNASKIFKYLGIAKKNNKTYT